jgi:hypothetical protein
VQDGYAHRGGDLRKLSRTITIDPLGQIRLGLRLVDGGIGSRGDDHIWLRGVNRRCQAIRVRQIKVRQSQSYDVVTQGGSQRLERGVDLPVLTRQSENGPARVLRAQKGQPSSHLARRPEGRRDRSEERTERPPGESRCLLRPWPRK